MLEVCDLYKKLGDRQVLNGVSFSVKNEIKVIIGLNGSGKSTLLKVIAGIFKPEKGKVILNNSEITFIPPEERNIGYVPQHLALFNHLTVEENIKYSLKNGRGAEDKFDEIVKMLKIEEYLQRFPKELSGGYKSRVSLARALFSQPKLMLLDEPLSDVDLASKERLLPEFKDVLKTLDMPVLYVTHDPWEAEQIGESFSIMNNGKIKKIGSADEAFKLMKEDNIL